MKKDAILLIQKNIRISGIACYRRCKYLESKIGRGNCNLFFVDLQPFRHGYKKCFECQCLMTTETEDIL